MLAVELADRESRSSWRDFLLGLRGRRPSIRRLVARGEENIEATLSFYRRAAHTTSTRRAPTCSSD